MTTTAGEEVRQGQLPLVPREVLIQFVLPHAFDSFEQALELMLLCRAAHDYATTAREFWEPFLWRRLHETVIPYLKSAYHRHAQPLVKLLQQKYVMWPKDILEGGPRGVMDVVPDRWGDLNPVVCTKCRNVQATPWWRCVDCPDHDVKTKKRRRKKRDKMVDRQT
ncbi:uncharacterized protein ACA1_137290 [Acanthamoeba castellanii str. Neff]|uniref:Uncharacterized protein n=1 Tax=Acanthamoeba castellanii (strain ATCC 30010 / Neff) TaxID=1257118 RepID=L8H0S7_ACACF|nr:uncharacterized protein ACA1_137290 [Acanthamoeba castellanii str. Neff]ELR18378.1 hypothetical protein ACA1_137290 [Acanthamoeba castellanii str. Neff]